MPDYAGPDTPPPPFLHTWSRHSGLREAKVATGGAVAAASLTATANQAMAVPIHVPWPYPVRRVFWVNGSAASGNRDFGIYTMDSSPRRIYSTGSTAASGTSAPQYVTPTAFTLPPGDYYFIFNSGGTTNALFGNAVTAALQRYAGIRQQAVGAVAIPDPFVPATPTVATVGIWGVTSTPSGF